MRADRLKSFLWILPFFLAGFQPVQGEGVPSGSYPGQSEPSGFLPVWVSSPASSPEGFQAGGEGGTTAPSGGTEVARPRVVPPDRKKGEEREIIARMELLENLELLKNLDLFEDFFLVVKEGEDNEN
jgi:hypothetical protein